MRQEVAEVGPLAQVEGGHGVRIKQLALHAASILVNDALRSLAKVSTLHFVWFLILVLQYIPNLCRCHDIIVYLLVILLLVSKFRTVSCAGQPRPGPAAWDYPCIIVARPQAGAGPQCSTASRLRSPAGPGLRSPAGARPRGSTASRCQSPAGAKLRCSTASELRNLAGPGLRIAADYDLGSRLGRRGRSLRPRCCASAGRHCG